jgi:hypothetical protein
MKGKFIFLLFNLLLTLTFISTQTQTEQLETNESLSNTKIIKVDDTNYQDYIDKNDFVVIFIHAPWSNDSKKMLNQYSILPHEIKENQNKNEANNENLLKIGYLETTNKSVRLNHRYNIRGYPSILLVKKDKHFIYKGEMKLQDIVSWVKNKISNNIEEIKSVEDITNLMQTNGVAVSYIGEINDFYEEYLKAVDNFPDYKFHKITNLEILKNLNINNDYKNLQPKIFIFKTFDDHLNIFSPKNNKLFTNDNIIEFIRGYYNPSINSFSSNNHIYVVNNKIPFSILVYNSNTSLSFEEDISPENSTVLYKDYYSESLKYRSKLFFMMGNYSDLLQTTLMQDFDFTENDLPIIIIQGFNNDKTKYERFKTNIEQLENLNEFFDRYKYKALERFFKSEDIPRNEFISPNVYKIVRKNFMEKVINNEKNVILFLTRRNCGLCNEVIF